MHNARTRGHALNFIGSEHMLVPHAVFVSDGALQNISQYFHVPVAVHTESLSRGYAIFVNDSDAVEPHMLRVKIIGKRKCVRGVQPPVIGVAPLFTSANLYHVF